MLATYLMIGAAITVVLIVSIARSGADNEYWRNRTALDVLCQMIVCFLFWPIWLPVALIARWLRK